jgi:fatty acid desaturase
MAYCPPHLGSDDAKRAGGAWRGRSGPGMSVPPSSHAQATLAARARVSIGLESDLAALRRQRPLRRLAEIAFFSALWAAAIAIGVAGLSTPGAAGWVLRLVSIAAAAAALNAFYLLSHEGHHHLLFRGAAANHAANVALCVPLLHAPSAYRVLHELHHRYLGGPGDPDEYRNYTGDPRLRWTLQWIRLTIGTLVYMPLIPAVAWRRANAIERRRIALEYGGMTVIWIAVFRLVPLDVLLQVWLIPGVVVGYISAVRALAQHALTDAHDPLLASRSVRSNRLVSFLLLNENYHLEHHLFPEVPSYNLPRLRQALQARLPHTVEAASYSGFLVGFVRRCLRGDESPLGLREHAPLSSEVKS